MGVLLGVSASLQAVLTPDLGPSFPDVLFFAYFASHPAQSPLPLSPSTFNPHNTISALDAPTSAQISSTRSSGAQDDTEAR